MEGERENMKGAQDNLRRNWQKKLRDGHGDGALGCSRNGFRPTSHTHRGCDELRCMRRHATIDHANIRLDRLVVAAARARACHGMHVQK